MTELWSLPRALEVGGQTVPINADFRDILEVFSYLNDPSLPEFIRWEIALALFYTQPVQPRHKQQAAKALADFISYGTDQSAAPGPKLLDWQQDAPLILADVNKVAGQEIRALPFVHWWTFLSWFNAVGEGQLSTVVAIRDKLARGKKLESWEQSFYRENRQKVDLKKHYSPQELIERKRLQQMLEQSEVRNK